MFDGLLAPNPLLPAALVPVLPVADVPVAELPLADAPLAPPAPPPPLDCAWAIATANIKLANKPTPCMTFFIFNSSAFAAKTELPRAWCDGRKIAWSANLIPGRALFLPAIDAKAEQSECQLATLDCQIGQRPFKTSICRVYVRKEAKLRRNLGRCAKMR
jgi:hypothetical protein